MTKIITRYFDSAAAAHATRRELIHARKFSQKIIHLQEHAEGAAEALGAAGVAEATATAYQDRLASGGAVLLVQAGHKPLCVAQTTRDVTAQMGGAALAGLVEEVEAADSRPKGLSVMEDQPLMLSRQRDPASTNYYMADWPIPLISRRKPFAEALFSRHARMANWPFHLISRAKPYTGSMISRHGRMANFPIGLISRRKPYTESVFDTHARMANFPIGLISRRKPYTGSIFPRHYRMANWPFPHLINGKTGTNSLMPGSPRMANFPIPLTSKRKPFAGSIFSRHARMANFPIGLTSRRKPFTGSIFSRHARMADVGLPLVTRREEMVPGQSGSFSAMFGLPTIMRR